MGGRTWTLLVGVAGLLALAAGGAGLGSAAKSARAASPGAPAGAASPGASAGAASPGETRETPESPGRIVSTNLPTDEILLDLDAPGLVAVSPMADNPEISNVVDEAEAVPHRVRGQAEPILQLHPDRVFTFPFGQQQTRALLRQTGVAVETVPGARTLKQVRKNIRRIATVVGRTERAKQLLADMNETLERVRRRVEGAERPRVLLHNPGNVTSGAHTLFDELVSIAGGRNAAAEAGLEGSQSISMERVLALDPEVVFFVDYRGDAQGREVAPSPELVRDPLWQQVQAVREGRVYPLPERHVLSSSHHAAQAALDMARHLHPERFSEPPQ
jgi:iron complex transport system substrate-binding protein